MIPQLMLALLVRRRKKRDREEKRGIRRFYIHPLNQKRIQDGEFVTPVAPLNNLGPAKFKNYFRLTRSEFDFLVTKITPFVSHPRNHRTPISVEERLSVTLRHLASGDSLTSLSYTYRMGKSTVIGIIPEVCKVLWSCLKTEFLPVMGEEDWRSIAAGFWENWGFPNCVGAVDGKHCLIKITVSSLLTWEVMEAKALFQESAFGQSLSKGQLTIPGPAKLPGSELKCPHVFVGDAAFALTENMMKPFPRSSKDRGECVFNYRLSRARPVVENAFGILASRWRILNKPMETGVDTSESIIMASVVLHNFLRPKEYEIESAQVSTGMHAVEPTAAANPSSRSAREVRSRFEEFFMSEEGALPWQEDIFSLGTNQRRKGRDD